ncbi:unnamed protein product [Pedinophyceae sp. YPF-701]|nr:unnamed protein product [Pedinophyceae sp. YPF-701]
MPREEDVEDMKVSELKHYLRNADLAVTGRKGDLKERLKAHLRSFWAQQNAEATSTAQSALQPTGLAAENLEHFTVKRLRDELKARGFSPMGNKQELIDTLSAALSIEGPAASSGLLPADSQMIDVEGLFLDGLLDQALEQRELPADGTEANQFDRLCTAVEMEFVEALAEQGSGTSQLQDEMERVDAVVESLPVMQIKSLLASRKVPHGGTRPEAAFRLKHLILANIVNTREWGFPYDALSPDYGMWSIDDLEGITRDPALNIALVCDLSQPSQLAAARTVLEQLHTAQGPAADEHGVAQGGVDEGAAEGSERPRFEDDTTGVRVWPFVVDADGTVFRVAHQLLCLPTPLDVELALEAARAGDTSRAVPIGDTGSPEAVAEVRELCDVVLPVGLAPGDSALGELVDKLEASGLAGTGTQHVPEPDVALRKLSLDGFVVAEEGADVPEGAVRFACTVIDSVHGPVALAPTELEEWNPVEDLRGRLGGVRGADEAVAALEEMYAQQGGVPTEVRTHTPARLPAAALRAVRRTAARAFADLSLRDIAVVEGYFVADAEDAGDVAVYDPRSLGPLGQGPAARMLRNDTWAAETKEERLAAARAWAGSVNESLGLDALGNKREEEDGEGAAAASVPDLRPEGGVAALADGAGGVVTVARVDASPHLAEDSVVFLGAAAAGMCHSALLRHVLTLACTRGGLEPPAVLHPEAVANSALEPTPLSLDQETQGDGANEWQGSFAGGMPTGPPAGATFGAQYGLGPASDGGGNMTIAGVAGPAPEGHGAQSPHELPQHRRVWVLIGGASSSHHATGVNIWLKLRSIPGVRAEIMMLADTTGNRGRDTEAQRQANLLSKRTTLLDIGMDEAELPGELQLDEIVNPVAMPLPMEDRGVWVLPYGMALLRSGAHMQEACEAALRRASVAPASRSAELRDEVEAQRELQSDLVAAEVPATARLWGNDPFAPPPPPRFFDLDTLTAEAWACGAEIFLALSPDDCEYGAVQEYLETRGVPFTGPLPLGCQLPADRISTAEQLSQLEPSGISTPPMFALTPHAILAQAYSLETAAAHFEELRGSLMTQGAFTVAPLWSANEHLVPPVRLETPEDLHAYAKGIIDGKHQLEGGVLSQHPEPAGLPRPGCGELVVQPYIQSDPVLLVRSDDGRSHRMVWPGAGSWARVSIGLLGHWQNMRAMTPSMRAVEVDSEDEATRPGGPQGRVVYLTPPPEDVISPAAIEGAQQRAAAVALAMSLRGVAVVDCFMQVDTGELVVMRVDPLPDLGPGSIALRQGMVEEPVIFPNYFFELCLNLVGGGLDSDVDPLGNGLGVDAGGFADSYDSEDDSEDEAELDEDLLQGGSGQGDLGGYRMER